MAVHVTGTFRVQQPGTQQSYERPSCAKIQQRVETPLGLDVHAASASSCECCRVSATLSPPDRWNSVARSQLSRSSAVRVTALKRPNRLRSPPSIRWHRTDLPSSSVMLNRLAVSSTTL